MEFKVGERVRFIDDVGEATIIKIIDQDFVLIEDDNGFEYQIKAIELMPSMDRGKEFDAYDSMEPSIREIIDKNIDSEKVKAAEKDFNSKYKGREESTYIGQGFMEVDLHIHELIDNEMGMDASSKLDLQMRHFERMLKSAEQQRIYRIVFIHGVGQGVLRQTIRENLRQYYPNMSFHDGDYGKYGYGATEIRVDKRK